jgi:hypothetical protein
MGLFGKKNKVNLNDFKFDPTLHFESKQRDDYSPEAFTFRHANTIMTIAMAKNWFGEDDAIPATSIFDEAISADMPEWALEIEVDSSLLNTDRYFENSTRIGWSHSKLGKKFQAQVEKLGATVHLMPCPQDLSKDILTGNWQLCDGRTLIQMGEIWRNDATGNEFVYWHIDGLVRTRPPMFAKDDDLALKVFLPYMFQSTAYLSESPFPSTPIVMRTREEQFGVSSPGDIPKIAFHTENNIRNFATAYQGNQKQAVFFWTPQSTQYGYIFEENQISDSMNEALITVLDALPKVGDILADGYCNCGPGSGLYFQASCYADRTVFSPESVAPIFLGEFVPGALYGDLDLRALNVYNSSAGALGDGIEKDDEELVNLGVSGLFDLMNNGCGSSVAHSVNTLFYNQLSNREAFLGEIDGQRFKDWVHDSKIYLNFVSKLDIDSQNANALSNLASLYLEEENFEEAQKCVNEGLEILENVDTNKTVSFLWAADTKASLPIRLELMAHQMGIHLENDKNDQAVKVAKEIVAIAESNNYDDGSVLAAKYILGQSDTGTPRY